MHQFHDALVSFAERRVIFMERQPKNEKLLQYFKDICLIPRQTGDEEAISQYLLDFAKARGLQAERDAHHNVMIRKPSTIPGYNGPTVIVQGHMTLSMKRAQIALINMKMVSMLQKKMVI